MCVCVCVCVCMCLYMRKEIVFYLALLQRCDWLKSITVCDLRNLIGFLFLEPQAVGRQSNIYFSTNAPTPKMFLPNSVIPQKTIWEGRRSPFSFSTPKDPKKVEAIDLARCGRKMSFFYLALLRDLRNLIGLKRWEGEILSSSKLEPFQVKLHFEAYFTH